MYCQIIESALFYLVIGSTVTGHVRELWAVTKEISSMIQADGVKGCSEMRKMWFLFRNVVFRSSPRLFCGISNQKAWRLLNFLSFFHLTF